MADLITIDRAVVQQALEALEAWDARDKWRITQDLRAALAQVEPDLVFQLLAAANYIDALGGDSKSYRATIAKATGAST